jgi:hypothetical protein
MHGGSNILKYEAKKINVIDPMNNRDHIANDDHKNNTKVGTAGSTKELTLPFHTDFYQKDALEPGPKAEYTVTIYLNDDYTGGQIDYRIFNGNESDFDIVDGELIPKDMGNKDVPKLTYMPQAGDIIIFPSRPPFYHGVRKVTEGTKRFVRMF